jgi:uncharacterized membrane protein
MDQHPALQEQIRWYVRHGYRVVNQTATTAQLVKPKRFSFLWAILWLLMFGVGLLVYLLYYAAKKDTVVYLEVVNGKVKATKG